MDDRDVVFDLLLDLADITHERNLPETSSRIKAMLDGYLRETGRGTLPCRRAAPMRLSRAWRRTGR